MSSTACAMPELVATTRAPRSVLSGEESRSGSSRPKTFFAPEGAHGQRRAHRAVDAAGHRDDHAAPVQRRARRSRRIRCRDAVDLGRAVEVEHLRRCSRAWLTCARRRRVARQAACTAARLRATNAVDVVQAVEVLRHHLLVVDGDAVGLLEEADQLEEAGRVEDVLLHERVAVGAADAARPSMKLSRDELARPCSLTSCMNPFRLVAMRMPSAALRSDQASLLDLAGVGLRQLDRRTRRTSAP